MLFSHLKKIQTTKPNTEPKKEPTQTKQTNQCQKTTAKKPQHQPSPPKKTQPNKQASKPPNQPEKSLYWRARNLTEQQLTAESWACSYSFKKTQIPACCSIRRIKHNSNFPPVSFSTVHNHQWGMPHPSMSCQSRKHKAHASCKALDITAPFALRRNSSSRVKLEQFPTIKQEEHSQETAGCCLALAMCWQHAHSKIRQGAVPSRGIWYTFSCSSPESSLAVLFTGCKAVRGHCWRSQAASSTPGPKALLTAPLSDSPAPTQQSAPSDRPAPAQHPVYLPALY